MRGATYTVPRIIYPPLEAPSDRANQEIVHLLVVTPIRTQHADFQLLAIWREDLAEGTIALFNPDIETRGRSAAAGVTVGTDL